MRPRSGERALLKSKLQRIKVVALDVDGVLTSGNIQLDGSGNEIKEFNIQDGLGLVLLAKAGYKTAIISARKSEAVRVRAKELKINRVYQGARPKESAYERMLRDFKVTSREVCFVGDDLNDIRVLRRSGFAVAVPVAAVEVRRVVDYVTKKSGGGGAVRELAELILKATGKWKGVIEEYC